MRLRRNQPRKSIEGSLNYKTSAKCRRVLVATWNFPFCVLPDCNPTLSPLSPDVWLFIPLRWRSVFQWAPCGAQEVTLGPAAVPSSPRFHHQRRISTRLYSCKGDSDIFSILRETVYYETCYLPGNLHSVYSNLSPLMYTVMNKKSPPDPNVPRPNILTPAGGALVHQTSALHEQ